MIEREKIEEIKRQADIVEVISQSNIQLKKVGKNYRALCPFHSEKAPSFYVSPDKGIYYCFGCKKGGNAINFLMEYEHLDFPDALKKLAKMLGIEIDTTKGLKHKEIYDANEIACQFYSMVLARENGKRGLNYLKERKANLEKLKDFRLGFAPSSGGLVTFMRQRGINSERLNQAGLISSGREIFHDRLIFPLFNLSGRVIGFGGRGIDEHIQPKYLNSPETPIFKKGESLYGLFQAKETMRLKNEAILVEGYFDLLSLYQQGIKNICAPLGTSLTEKQALLISRYARKVNLLFDGDMSGIKAALRAIGLLINAQVDVSVTTLPNETDPDEYIRENGTDSLNRLISAAPDFFHFYKNNVKAESVEDEITLIKDLIQIISNIQDPIRFDRYLKYIVRVFDISEEVVKNEMGIKTAVPKMPLKKISITPEERLLAIILTNQDYLNDAEKILMPEDFFDEKVRQIYLLLLKDRALGIWDVSEIKIDEALRDKLLSLLVKEEKLSPDDFVKALKDYKNYRVNKKKIRPQIIDAIKSGDNEALRKYKELLEKGLKGVEEHENEGAST